MIMMTEFIRIEFEVWTWTWPIDCVIVAIGKTL